MTGGANVLKVFRIIPDVDPTNTTDKFSGKCFCNTDAVSLCYCQRRQKKNQTKPSFATEVTDLNSNC